MICTRVSISISKVSIINIQRVTPEKIRVTTGKINQIIFFDRYDFKKVCISINISKTKGNVCCTAVLEHSIYF